MRILLTGKSGMVGWELERSLPALGEVFAFDHTSLDLAQPDQIIARVREVKPHLIVNAAAYTAVDRAESEPELAMRVNGAAPGIFAEEAKRLGALLVHYSTDYVFDGTKTTPYAETDPPNPINAYGRSKLEGEQAIQASGCRYLILRTSWVYGMRGRNFLLTILRLARERPELCVVDDQVGAPTWARNIADATARVAFASSVEQAAGRFEPGIFNLVASGTTSWHGFAQTILQGAVRYGLLSAQSLPRLRAVPTQDYPLPARRPTNSCLAVGKIKQRFHILLPEWPRSLDGCLQEQAVKVKT